MNAWRTLITARRQLAFVLFAVVLFARIIVPTGYMFTPVAGGIVVQLCSGQGPTSVVLNIGKSAPVEDHSGSGKTDAPCAFSGVGMGGLAAVDPVLLIGAIAFVVAIGILSTRVAPGPSPARLRPPLRGPPARA